MSSMALSFNSLRPTNEPEIKRDGERDDNGNRFNSLRPTNEPEM